MPKKNQHEHSHYVQIANEKNLTMMNVVVLIVITYGRHP
jgi:hypothetical protein